MNRLLQREGQASLGRNPDPLALGRYLSSGPHPRSGSRADCRACAAAGECADNRSERRRPANHFTAARGARIALLRKTLGIDLDRPSIHVERDQIERQNRPAFDLAGLLVVRPTSP